MTTIDAQDIFRDRLHRELASPDIQPPCGCRFDWVLMWTNGNLYPTPVVTFLRPCQSHWDDDCQANESKFRARMQGVINRVMGSSGSPPKTPSVGLSDFPDDELREIGDKIMSLDSKRLDALEKYLESLGVTTHLTIHKGM